TARLPPCHGGNCIRANRRRSRADSGSVHAGTASVAVAHWFRFGQCSHTRVGGTESGKQCQIGASRSGARLTASGAGGGSCFTSFFQRGSSEGAARESTPMDDSGLAGEDKSEVLSGPRGIYGQAPGIQRRRLPPGFSTGHGRQSVSWSAKRAGCGRLDIRFCWAAKRKAPNPHETVGDEVGESIAGRGSYEPACGLLIRKGTTR